MDGYLHRPDLTRDCMIEDWYRTGDLGVIESDGQIVLHGRLKDEINRAGTKIQPAELDMLIDASTARVGQLQRMSVVSATSAACGLA